MNFGNLGFSEILVIGLLGFVFRVLPILIAIWLLVEVRRLRGQINRLTERLDAQERR